MELKTSILIISLLAIIHHISGQILDSRFIVQLGHFRQPFLNETLIRCVGTLISQQHILTTASCVYVESPTEIAVNIEIVTIIPEGGNTSSSTLVPANEVFIHPHYVHNLIHNLDRIANAAIVRTNAFINNPYLGFVPRSFGALSTSSSCYLFGWGGELLNPRRDAVVINDPQLCDSNFPQSFCSFFDSALNPTCRAWLGSPLICENETIVAGFMTSPHGCYTNSAGRVMLNYHSVDHFRDWIEGIFGPQLPERNPVNFIVTVMQFIPPVTSDAVARCFGTVITSSRVLTTVDCASVQSPFDLAVQTRIVEGSTSISSISKTRLSLLSPSHENNIVHIYIELASAVFIHPNFRQQEPFVNNVAVIEVGELFDERIIPRSLGSLQSGSSCQLFGWGPTDIGFTRGDAITVYGSQFCNSSLPQAFCSYHPTIFHYSCNAMTGSSVSCGNESIISGILINNASCSTNDGRVSLNFHSVSQFSEWILDPTSPIDDDDDDPNAAVYIKMSPIVVIFVAFINNLINIVF